MIQIAIILEYIDIFDSEIIMLNVNWTDCCCSAPYNNFFPKLNILKKEKPIFLYILQDFREIFVSPQN